MLRHAVASDLEDIAHDARWGLSRADEALGDLETAIEGLEVLYGEPELKGGFSRLALARRLARTSLEHGENTRAIEVAESALASEKGQEVVDAEERAELAATLVACYYERGDLTRAHMLLRQVIRDAEEVNSTRARAAAYWEAGIVAEARGELRQAMLFTEKALALYGDGDNARGTAALRLNCAWLMLRSPRPETAKAKCLIEQAIEVLEQVGTNNDLASAEAELARCHVLDDDSESAVVVARKAVARFSGGRRLASADAWLVLARAERGVGNVEAAVSAYRIAAEELKGAGHGRRAAAIWHELGDDLLSMGMTDDAVNAYQHTAEAARVPRFWPQWRAAPTATAGTGRKRTT